MVGQSDLPSLEDDDLYTLEVRSWAEGKYRLVKLYAEMFSTSMKDRWGYRIYIDLFAGPGRSRIQESGRIVPGSPMIALDVPDRFNRYIFCEKDETAAAALEARVQRDYEGLDVRIFRGDANERVDDIMDILPRPTRNSTVLSFCFLDPFRLSDLRFETIRMLSTRYADFLILIPSGFDGQRNWYRHFLEDDGTPLDGFVGTPHWREAWQSRTRAAQSFEAFLTDFFCGQMKELGFRYGGVDSSVLIRMPGPNIRLYRLGFFSKSEMGDKLWREAKKYSHPQLGMNF